MRHTTFGCCAFDSIEDLKNSIIKSYQESKEEVQGSNVDQTEVIKRLKETCDMFALAMDDLESADGQVEEVKEAVARSAELEEEVTTLRAEKAVLQEASKVQEQRLADAGPVVPVADFIAYARQLSELHDRLSLSQIVFLAILSKSREDIRDGRLSQQDQRFTEHKFWAEYEGELERSLQALREKTAELHLPVDTYLHEDEQLLAEVMRLAVEAGEHVRSGEEMRTQRDAKLKVFYASCAKLTGWCRQQLTNMEAMQEPDHVQEFCAALADNYPTMSKNFAVLLESVQEYVRANLEAVHKALMEAAEVWLYLQVSTLELLSKTLFEIHPRSPLDVEVEKYSGYPEKVLPFLENFEKYLEAQSDAASESEDVDTMRKNGQQLQSILNTTFAELPDEVRAFAKRAKALRAGYQCFREAVLQRVTYISPVASVVVESKRRQEEFEECVRELKEWAVETSHGESWRDIYSRIVEIKKMLKDEQNLLDWKRECAMSLVNENGRGVE